MGKEALQRLHSFLADAPVSAAEAPWRTPEPSPFKRSAQPSDPRNSSPLSAGDGGLTDYRREEQIEQLEQTAAKLAVSNEESVARGEWKRQRTRQRFRRLPPTTLVRSTIGRG